MQVEGPKKLSATGSMALRAKESIEEATDKAAFTKLLSDKLAEYDALVTAHQKVNQLFEKI